MAQPRRLFRVFRFDPQQDRDPVYQTYIVDCQPHWSVLMALLEIATRKDASLAFRRSCRHGICGSCAMTINGENRLACETRVASLSREPIEVEPLRSMPVIKDLVVDLSELFERYRLVRPYLIAGEAPPQERLQSPAERRLLDGSYECIMCGACTSSCPSFWARRDFLGPAALLAASRWVLDSRDEAGRERLQDIDNAQGLWRCHNIFNCAEACPQGAQPHEGHSQTAAPGTGPPPERPLKGLHPWTGLPPCAWPASAPRRGTR
ncbi:MAG: succinate dehydrogenase iron-sulfur subunit [Pseudomonadota bacterium]